MNQDFLLSGSAGSARNLVRLSGVTTITLDPAIIDLAKTGLIDFGDSEFTKNERAAIQRLCDYDFRAIFPIPIDQHHVVVAAARFANVEPIFILTRTPRKWFDSLRKYGYVHDETCFILNPGKKKEFIDADLIRDRRHGLLIIDEMIGSGEAAIHAQDFPKTVFVTHRRLVSDLSDLIAALFPAAPYDLLTNVNALFKRTVEVMGFNTVRPADLAFLMNVVTDLMVISQEIESPAVDIDPELYAKLERNVALGHLRLDDC